MKVQHLDDEMTERVSFDFRFGAHVPTLAGCYVLTNIYDDILYIGQTIDLCRRMEEHLKDPRMNQRTRYGLVSWFYYTSLPSSKLRDVELQLLAGYKFAHGEWPPLNRTGP